MGKQRFRKRRKGGFRMKEAIIDLRDSFLVVCGSTVQFAIDLFTVILLIAYMPFYPFVWLFRSYRVSVWYKYHFTQYYQKHLNERTIDKIFRVLRRERNNTILCKYERIWATKIIRRYRLNK